MDWLFIYLALVPMVMCPRYLFNGFALPQILAVSLLSAASVVVGGWKGNFCLSAPTYLVLVFLIYTFLTALRTKPIHNARKELGLQVPVILLFLTLPANINDHSIKVFAISTSIICFLICIYAVGQTMGYDHFFPNKIKMGGPKNNAIGTIGNPNFLSSYLCATFWLTIYAGVICHWGFFLCSLISLYTCYKTRSRAGQVAIVGSVVFFGLCCAYKGWLPYSQEIFMFGLLFVFACIVSLMIVMRSCWWTFWHSKIDPDAKVRVWFASFRYRLCYWLVALHLIKKKWLFGWGLWSYRKEVYEGQAELGQLYPEFMDKDRYITPQPRECHNDWIEHVFEYGVVGAGIFFFFVGTIIFGGMKSIDELMGNLILLTSMVTILINMVFFFSLRMPPTAMYFWIISAILLAISGKGTSYSVSIPWWIIFLLTILFTLFLWECVVKRVISSRFFMRSMQTANGEEKYGYLCKAIEFSPDDTSLRTHATVMTGDSSPVVSHIHAMKAIEHFDGQITQWAVLYNYALTALKGYRNFFDIQTYYLKKGHYLLNYFKPINQLLTGRESVSLRTIYTEGAKMRVMDEAQIWKIRTFVAQMDSLNKDHIILSGQKENLDLRIKNSQQQLELAKANVENLVLYEKKRLNIPDSWIFNVEQGIFQDPSSLPEEDRKKLGLEG